MTRKTATRIGDAIATAAAVGGLLLLAHTATAADAPPQPRETAHSAATVVTLPGALPAWLRPYRARYRRAQDRYENRPSTRNLRRAIWHGARYAASVKLSRPAIGARCRIFHRRNGGATVSRCTAWSVARVTRRYVQTTAITFRYDTHEDASARAVRVRGWTSGARTR